MHAKINEFTVGTFLFMLNSKNGPRKHPYPDTSHLILSDLNLTFQGHSRSKQMVPIESQYPLSYSSSIVTMGLGGTITQIQAIFIASDLNLTFQGHPRSKWTALNESQ